MATDARSICPDDRQAREEAGRPLTADLKTRLAFAAEIAANTFGPKHLGDPAHPQAARTLALTLQHRRAQCWAVQDEDFVLLDRWKDGNTDAGDELMRRHFDSLCNFFRSKVDSGVEDLVQDVLLRCVERREQFRGEASFRTYLFVIARRILLDRLRKEYRRGTPLNFSEVSLVDLGTTPSQAVARDQGRAVLIAALRELPVDFQIAVELTYWENLSAPEVGRVLGINPNTVRSRLARARKALDGTLRLLEERTDKMTER